MKPNDLCFVLTTERISSFVRPFLATLLLCASANLWRELADPCEFPSPTLSSSPMDFALHCQLEYHQVPYLCDPAGMLSRTEAELLDRQIHNLLNGYNSTGCACSASRTDGQKLPLLPLICQNRRWRRRDGPRLAVVLVPYANMGRLEIS